MRPHWLAILVTALLLTASVPATAFAGGWSVVVLDTLPTNVVQGQEIVVGFNVLQHGKTPLAKLSPTIEFAHPPSGRSFTVDAHDDGAPGHYVARFTVPEPGAWTWTIDAFEGDHPMPALEVAAAPASAALNAPASLSLGASWPLAASAALVAAGAMVGILGWRRAIRAPRRG